MSYAFSMGSERWPGVAKLIEECGELTQVLGKLVQIDGDSMHWDGDLTPRIVAELGDVQAAISFLLEADDGRRLDKAAVAKRAALKLAQFWDWREEGLHTA